MYGQEEYDLSGMAASMEREKKVQSLLASYTRSLRELEERAKELQALLEKERADVEKLEGGSLRALFTALVDPNGTRLARERQEALEAQVRYDAALAQIEQTKQQIALLRKEQEALWGSEERFQAAFLQKSEAIKARDKINGPILVDLERGLYSARAQKKELTEAYEAANGVLSEIERVDAELDDAEGLGTWDMLGGGLMVSLAKHERLDRAQAGLELLQGKLNRLRAELDDVRLAADFQIAVEGFSRFADFFFDGLFVDWAVQKKIHTAQERLWDTRSGVREIEKRLSNMLNENERETKRLESRRTELVMKL